MPIALSHGGSNIYTSQEPSREVLVGTRDGIVVLRRGSGPTGWDVAHRALVDKFISSVVIEQTSGTIFAGAYKGGVYASEDGGQTWQQRDDGLGLDEVWSMAVGTHQGRPRVFAGTNPAHLYRSDNLGKSWQEAASMRNVPSVDQWSFFNNPAHTKFIAFDPNDPSIVYSCIEQGSFLRSTDGGESWQELNSLGFYKDRERPWELFYDCHKTVIDPRNPDKIFVSGGAGLYVTEDGGKTWERWMSPDWAVDVYPDALVLNPRHPDVMFVGAAEHNPARWRDNGIPGFSGSRLFRSHDAGKTWEILKNGLPGEPTRQEYGAVCLEDWGGSFTVLAATTGGDVYCSDDGGDSWTLAVSGLPPVSKGGHYRSLNAGTYQGLAPAIPVATVR